MDICGYPKTNYYYYQEWWRIWMRFTWRRIGTGKDKKAIPSLYGATATANPWNCSSTGKALAGKPWIRFHISSGKVLIKPGVLEARGIRDGRKLTERIETTGPPVSIILNPDRNSINGDGEDVSVINVSVADEKGREVADAGNLITFELKGNGRIIGVGNGHPSSHEADKCLAGKYQRRLFNGKCQLIVQSGTGAGTIEVIASTAGLKPGSALIQAGTCTPRPGVESIK